MITEWFHIGDHLHQQMPFPIHSLQVDGDSEFRAEFEQSCQDQDIPLYVIPPPRKTPNITTVWNEPMAPDMSSTRFIESRYR